MLRKYIVLISDQQLKKQKKYSAGFASGLKKAIHAKK